VQFGAPDLNFNRTYTYSYTYSQTNRVLTQTMGWNMYTTNSHGNPTVRAGGKRRHFSRDWPEPPTPVI